MASTTYASWSDSRRSPRAMTLSALTTFQTAGTAM